MILCCSERLCANLDFEARAWEAQEQVDLVAICNNQNAYPTRLVRNAVGLLAQVRTPIS